ncbi:CHU large protein [Seminavis robusta]|uniref:CHU large protein n=1 Tax=Seminavis robusta TaxID=568900 RepID=A0A9N8EYQ5_9STRA|nr:CHU large protein [Seminavis robusta]|eukprot:Sro2533_g330470.1 CHU large protein (421) ;mRNA; f:4159-5518
MRISVLSLGYALLALQSEYVGAGGLRNLHATAAPTFTPTTDTLTDSNATSTNATMAPSTDSPTSAPPPTDPPATAPPTSRPTGAPSTSPSLAPIAPVPPNDLCANAQGPLAIVAPVKAGTLPDLFVHGTTRGASKDVTVGRCGVEITSPGVWYTVTGTGSRMTISTCSEDTELDSKLSVFSGSSCGALSCVAGNDDGTNSTGRYCNVHRYASSTYWVSELGQNYYILVHGFSNRVGDFALSVEGHNDRMELAVQMAVGDTAQGDTLTASFNLYDLLSSQCGYDDKEFYGQYYDGPEDRVPRGLWYKVVGTGGPLQAQVCLPGTRLHVFAGDNNDNCIGGDTYTRDCSTFAWDSSPDVTYYVIVHSLFRVLLPYGEYNDDRYNNPQFWNEDTIPNFSKPFELAITGGSDSVTISRSKDLFN